MKASIGSNISLHHSDDLEKLILPNMYKFSGLNSPTAKSHYEQTNELVEKLSEIGFFMTNLAFPCFILPKVIFNFFNYFTSDLGNDAFDLPAPIW